MHTPLEHTILRIHDIFGDKVIPILKNLITPPGMELIGPSFKSLFELQYYDQPNDDGSPTIEGKFASSLGVDLTLSKLILYGIKLGVVSEAVAIAAGVSLDKHPFVLGSRFYPETLHRNITMSVCGQVHFDEGLFSQPMMLLRCLIWVGS